MSRNGTGTYNLPAGNPVVTGTTISSTWANTTLTDIATALTNSVATDGQTPITGALIGPNGTVAFGGVGQTRIPSGTTAQRSASPVNGMIRFNTDLNQYEGYRNGSWSIFGNGAGGTLFSDTVTATQGQTLFNLPTGYVQGGDNLSVYVNGSRQIFNVNYTETSTSSFTFASGLNAGDLVNYTIGASTSLSVNAASVLYNEGGTNAVNRNVEQKLQEYVSVKDFGAVGDNSTNDTTAFTNALAYCKANNQNLIIPSGIYVLTSGVLNFGADNLHIYGDGKPTLQFIGTGKGFELNPPALGYFVNQTVENLIIRGGSAITDGLYAQGFARGILRNIEVKEVTGNAFSIYGSVSCLFDSLKYSASSHTNKAVYGIYLTDAGIPAINFTADCTFLNCISEDFITGVGVYVFKGSGNTFIGGTYEACATGLVISATSRLNNFDGVWFEANVTKDIEVDGTSNSFNNCNFSSPSSSLNVQISTGKNTTISGGYVRAANLSSLSSNTLFIGCAFDENTTGTLGIQGTGTYKCIGLTKADNAGLIVGTMPDVVGDSGSFTTTASGLTTSPTGTVTYNKIGNTVTLNIPTITGTSNATTFDLNNLPTILRPTNSKNVLAVITDNGTTTVSYATVQSNGFIVFYASFISGSFVTSGTKGVFSCNLTYALN
jgi:hypothetical protein